MQSSFFRASASPALEAVGSRRCATPSRRAAFTLVELLAALGISVLLIAAISASFDIYLRVTTTGQVAIERQQVTRAILDQMTRDVASIVFRPAETAAMADDSATSTSSDSAAGDGATSESGSGSGEDAGSADSTTVTVQDPESSWSTTNLGIVGDSQMLVLHVSWPQDDLSYIAPQSTTSLTDRTSDRLSVSYFMALPGGDGLSGAVAALQASAIT
ncbi:MAG: prepilin-type N-terminal cleavage/methylation domain-containing protein, partial [Planctomycetaceae bacterium]|nr:prepilin-type N-terminal cleavage/methylation domain-containing protein [Planctomycetaceae bacterium]